MMKRALRPIIAAIISVVVFVFLAYTSKILIIPRLSPAWQNDLLWLGGTALVTITILAGLAQIIGISMKDLFIGGKHQKSSKSIQENIPGSIIINTDSKGVQNIQGDILQSSTKLVIEQANVVSPQGDKSVKSTDRLIRDIQAALYGEEKQLPYALALCLDLCQQVGLASKYELWLRKELNGYDNYEEFKNSFPNEETFEEWMQRWGDHRLVKTYVKFGYRSTEDNRWHVEDWPFHSLVVGFSISEIIRNLDSARRNNTQEFPISIKALDKGMMEKLRSDVVKYFPNSGAVVPDDLAAYYKPSDLSRLLNGVRNLVLSLLNEARSLQGG